MPTHYLCRNLNTTTPSNHLVVDVLTQDLPGGNSGELRDRPLRMWSARAFRWYQGDVTRVVSRQGSDPQRFWAMVAGRVDNARPLWIWTHGAGVAVTALGLWHQMDMGLYLLKEPDWRYAKRLAKNPRSKQRAGFVADSDPPTIIKLWSHGGQQIQIVDVQNWYRGSFHELVESLGEEPWVFLGDNPGSASAPDYGSWRLGMLCQTVTGLLNTVHRHDMGVMQATGPAQAMQCFRHRFMEAQMVVHEDPVARELERRCYYGGRVEPFFIGLIRREDSACPLDAPPPSEGGVLATSGPIYCLDVSSLYPSIMRVKKMPRSLRTSSGGPLDLRTVTTDTTQLWTADLTIRSATRTYPRREKDQTVYCTGEFRTSLCGPELVQAWIAGDVKAIHLAYSYDCQVCFTSYVDYWWMVRQDASATADHHTEAFAKMMLNSLYGKFGQKRRTWETVIGRPPRQRWGSYAERGPETQEPRLYRGIAGVLQVREEAEDYRHAMPAIAAWVTSHGRVLMDQLRWIARPQHVFYQATDSLYVDQVGYYRLLEAGEICPNTLGKLRLTGQADWMRIYGVNDYIFGTKVVRGGVSVTHADAVTGRKLQTRTHSCRYYLSHAPETCVKSWEEPVAAHDPQQRGKLGADGWVIPYERVEVPESCANVPF